MWRDASSDSGAYDRAPWIVSLDRNYYTDILAVFPAPRNGRKQRMRAMGFARREAMKRGLSVIELDGDGNFTRLWPKDKR